MAFKIDVIHIWSDFNVNLHAVIIIIIIIIITNSKSKDDLSSELELALLTKRY